MLEKYDRAVARYLENCKSKGMSAASLESYARTYKQYRESMVTSSFEEASWEATVHWKSELTDKNVSFLTMELYLRHLSYLSDFAIKCKIFKEEDAFIDESLFPTKNAVRAERNKEYAHQLSEEDILKILAATRADYTRTPHTWAREKAETVLILTSGLRNSELRSLTPNDFHWDIGAIFCRETKGDKPRWVPFTSECQKYVQAYLDSGLRPVNISDDAPMFGKVSRAGVWKALERTELSGLLNNHIASILGPGKGVNSHALRHAMASFAISNGMDVQAISQILGHADVRLTTKVYSKQLHPDRFAADFGKQMVAVMQTKEQSA